MRLTLLPFAAAALVAVVASCGTAKAGVRYAVDLGTDDAATGFTKFDASTHNILVSDSDLAAPAGGDILVADNSLDLIEATSFGDTSQSFQIRTGNNAIPVEQTITGTGWKLELWGAGSLTSIRTNRNSDNVLASAVPFTSAGGAGVDPTSEAAAVTVLFDVPEYSTIKSDHLRFELAGKVSAFRLTSTSGPVPGDQNDDGVVDLVDLDLAQRAGPDRATIAEIAENYGTAPPAEAAVATNVPEPSSFALLGIAVLMFGKRRSCRSRMAQAVR